MACGSSPGGGEIFPFFCPLIVSLRLGYLKAVSTSCWQTVGTSEVFKSVHCPQFNNYSEVATEKQLIIIIIIP